VGFARELPKPRIEHSRAAWGYLRMGDEARAVEIAQEALTSQPGDASLHELLGVVAAGRGDHRAAVGAFGRAAHARPDRPAPYFHLAKSLAAIGETPAALVAAQRAASLSPEPEHLALLADLLVQTGRPAEAAVVLGALSRLPGADRDAALARRAALCAEVACPALSPTNGPTP
jgi:Flp pilus assembly protein TadD